MRPHRVYLSCFVIALGTLLRTVGSTSVAIAPPITSQQSLRAVIDTRQVAQARTQRYALVIGIADYETAPLRNPVNDAKDMAATLGDLGFEVNLLLDATLPQIEAAVELLNQQLRRGGTGMVFYAGHGVQVKGENYLMPIGANINREQDVRYEAYPLGRLLGSLEDADNDLNIVILDACRNNPFARQWRSARAGLAPIQAAQGTLVAYATRPGGLADDGPGRNGVYTGALLKHIRSPLSVELMLKRVRADVIAATNERQVPWESSSLVGEFSFNPQAPAATVTPPAQTPLPQAPIAISPPTAPASEREPTSPQPESGSLQAYNRSAGFRKAPRFLDLAATFDTVNVTGSTYYFTIALPADAGGSLQKVVFQQREGQESIRYREKVRAYGGTFQKRRAALTLGPIEIDKTENTVAIEFEPPIPPGETFTVEIHPIRNPKYDGIYTFGVTAFPVGDRAEGLSLGSKRLDFHANDF